MVTGGTPPGGFSTGRGCMLVLLAWVVVLAIIILGMLYVKNG